MNYSELKKIIQQRNLTIKDVAEMLNVTRQGFQVSIENDNLPTKKVKELCAILEITPNDFFGTSSVNGNGNIVANIVGDNSKVIGGMVGYCTSCVEKDKEIKELQNKIIKLQEKLLKL